MNRTLARKVIELFRDDVLPDREYFAKYSERDWRKSKQWLDSSGMALYFLERLKNLHLDSTIPTTVLDQLEQNRDDRELEVKQRLECFAELLQLLQRENIRFAVEKGIALVPQYCPDLSLRFQVDFDFLVDCRDVEKCHELLLRRGYRHVPTIHGERRYNKGDFRIPSMQEFYQPKQRHTVEVHFNGSEEARAKLAKAVPHQVNALSFPVLCQVDCFVDYVQHFVKHLRCGWVRADALLEYRRFVRSVEEDRSFWTEVQRRCDDSEALREATAIMAMLAQKVLGVSAVPELAEFMHVAPAGVLRWVDRCAWNVLLAEYPGTKFYLILELASGKRPWLSCARMIFPGRYWPVRIAENDGNAETGRPGFIAQALFFFTRCRYHIDEIVRVTYELLAWNWASSGKPREHRYTSGVSRV